MIYYRKTLFGRGPKLTAVQVQTDQQPPQLMTFFQSAKY